MYAKIELKEGGGEANIYFQGNGDDPTHFSIRQVAASKRNSSTDTESKRDTESEEATHQPFQIVNSVQQNTAKVRQNMVKRYEQQHQIEVFSIGDIVTVHIPRMVLMTGGSTVWCFACHIPIGM